MATTSPLQGVPLPEPTDPVNVPGDLSLAVGDLEERSVMRFSSSGSRDATITSPVEGMVAWLNDTNLLTYYDGTTWRSVLIETATVPATTPVVARVTMSAVQAITDATFEPIEWDTEMNDDFGFHSGTTGTTSEKLICPTGYDGWYYATFQGRFGGNATGRRVLQIAKNGVATDASDADEEVAYTNGALAQNQPLTLMVAGLVYLTAGDFVRAFVWQNSATTLNFGGTSTTRFTLHRVL